MHETSMENTKETPAGLNTHQVNSWSGVGLSECVCVCVYVRARVSARIQKRRKKSRGESFTHVQSCGHTCYGSDDAFSGREESFSLEMLALSFYPKSLSPGGAPS